MKTFLVVLACIAYSKGIGFSTLGKNSWRIFKEKYSKSWEDGDGVSSVDTTKRIDYISPYNVKIPDTIDWRKLGAVTHPKFEGYCGATWAFAATGALEGQHFRKTGELVALSEQNLIDCSSKFGNKGCKGGTPENAFKYIQENGGIDTEKSYPTSWQSETPSWWCHYKSKNKGAEVKGYVVLPFGNEEKLKEAVATVGPIAVVFDGSQDSFQVINDFDIYEDEDCSSTDVNYGAVVVGYGTKEGKDYWLVKISLGGCFAGDCGTIKMARNKNNSCGIATSASYPLV